MNIQAKGIVRNIDGDEKEVVIETGLHGSVDTQLATAAIRALIQKATQMRCLPVSVKDFMATSQTEWRRDQFPDL